MVQFRMVLFVSYKFTVKLGARDSVQEKRGQQLTATVCGVVRRNVIFCYFCCGRRLYFVVLFFEAAEPPLLSLLLLLMLPLSS